MSNYSKYAEARKQGSEIIVTVEDSQVWHRASALSAMVGDSSNEKIAELATEIATKAVYEELKKTGAFNPDIESTAIIDSKYPIKL